MTIFYYLQGGNIEIVFILPLGEHYLLIGIWKAIYHSVGTQKLPKKFQAPLNMRKEMVNLVVIFLLDSNMTYGRQKN